MALDIGGKPDLVQYQILCCVKVIIYKLLDWLWRQAS